MAESPMLALPSISSAGRSERFLIVHAFVVPACLAAAAVLARASGFDEWLEALFFDPSRSMFPARQSALLEALGHRVAKSAVLGIWLLILAGAVVGPFVPRLRRYSSLLWTTAAAMAAGPVVVVVLKGMNSYRCPWDLARFGGIAQATSEWFVSRINAGRCFPSGHAAGGFSLIALCFAGMILGHPVLRRIGFAAALGAGAVFSGVRMVQGAHFLSHNLWSAAIDWCLAALVFAPSMVLSACDPNDPGGSSDHVGSVVRWRIATRSAAMWWRITFAGLLVLLIAVAAWFEP